MQCRDIRHLAVADTGTICASDGGARIDRLDGSWFTRWKRLPDEARIVALGSFEGDLLACDAGNNCIWRVRDDGVESFAGRLQPPTLAGNPRRGDGPVGEALFRSPTAMTIASGGVIVAEAGSAGPVIRLVVPKGVTTHDVVGSPVSTIDCLAPSAHGAFAIHTSGTAPFLFHVANTGSHFTARILAGSAADSGDADGMGLSARFARPMAVCPAPGGGCYVADGARLRVVTGDGNVQTLAGGAPGFGDGTASNARFGAIRAIALDQAHAVVVADTDNDALRSVDADGSVITIAGGPNRCILNDIEASRRNRHFARSIVDDDAAEGWALARGFLADHLARRNVWPDRTVQPVSTSSARVGKDLATQWSRSTVPERARLGSYCLWLILCEERTNTVDDIRDKRLLRMGRELADAT
ncbi:MAG TPA: hypothetical protein PLF26_00020 [Blastocatellia bacterium]|nr:hypothetical protein [Blastocatellia bacterium]